MLKTRIVIALGVVAAAAACASHALPLFEATSPRDVALDSVPGRNGRPCGQHVSVVDEGEYPGFRLVAGVSFDTTGGFLEGAVLAKAPREFLKRQVIDRPGTRSRPSVMSCPGGGGGSVGTLRVTHWDASDSVWIDGVAVAKGLDNVILIEVDSSGHWTVVGRAHVRARLTPPSQRSPADSGRSMINAMADGIWPALRESATVRRFMKTNAGPFGSKATAAIPWFDAQSASSVALDSLPPLGKNGMCPGRGGGVQPFARNGYGMGYEYTGDDTGNFLESAVIVRASREWQSRANTGPRPQSNRVTHRLQCGGLGAGFVGPMRVTLPLRTHEIWLDTTAVWMGFDNVLLIEIDPQGTPRVAGRAHVPPRLTPPSSYFKGDRDAEGKAVAEGIWRVLLSSEHVRRFMKD